MSHQVPQMNDQDRPIVLITGAAGNIGGSLARALGDRYQVIGLDLKGGGTDFPLIDVDFTDDASMTAAMAKLRDQHGDAIASVVHLAAFFDFSGEDKPEYEAVNVEGTRRLLRALQSFSVEQFLYSSTMLVHEPVRPGQRIDERHPISPGWAYPKSKAASENVVRSEHGNIPFVLLRLAGVYDATSSVPTFANQIARIYERNFQSHLYSGDIDAGQAMLHRDDMLDAFVRTIDHRTDLPPDAEILIGEPDAIGYDDLQDRLGQLLHGEDWATLRVPASIAAVGAWVQDKAEPLVPDALDGGERPFIQPFMTKMASDHYALDIARAEQLLGWRPRYRLADVLPAIVDTLKRDPAAWYAANRITAPDWIADAQVAGEGAESFRLRHEEGFRSAHRQYRWAHFLNILLGTWLVTQPPLIQVGETLLVWSEVMLGLAVIVCASLSLSWRLPWARWATAGTGALVMAVPFVFFTDNPAAFLSDTLVGALIFGLAVCTPPEVGPSAAAALTGPDTPPGWSYNPSAFTQRIPIIVLALVGVYIARYLTAYQLGQIDSVWDPFFVGSAADPQNGTEEIITSSVSKAWPVPDAAVGGYTYLLEILTGLAGSRRRWRTMPWLVILFGLMIAPLGVTSILFIIIQPIVIGTWSTIALIGAAAVLIQIPYSLDELLASLQFLRRRAKAGKSWLRVLLFGDTDEGRVESVSDEFDRAPGVILRDAVTGGVTLPWNLAVAALVGLSLLFTRVTFGATDSMANADHVIGSLVLTVVSIAAAEVARPVRYALVPLGIALIVTPLVYEASDAQMVANIVGGAALIAMSFRSGTIREQYGSWQRRIR